MSPRQADPQVRVALSETAARLLASEGPAALTTRRLAREVGTSTTAVYTHFGSKEEIVRGMVAEGFARLDRRLRRLRRTDDPVTDVAAMGWAYRRNALTNPHLYSAMFGRTMLDYEPGPTDRAGGLATLQHLIDAVATCAEAGRITMGEPWESGVGLWVVMHGAVSLEVNGVTAEPLFHPVATMRRVMRNELIGLGDEPDRVEASLARTRP